MIPRYSIKYLGHHKEGGNCTSPLLEVRDVQNENKMTHPNDYL